MARLQTADARDLRVFNAAGESVPLALDRSQATPAAETPEDVFTDLLARPIQDGTPAAANRGGVSVRITDAPDGSVIQLDAPAAPGRPAGSSADTPIDTAAPAAPTLGVLIDARAVKQAATAVHIEAALPNAQPVRFTLESSTDLYSWQARGEVTIYRFDDAMRTPARIALADTPLKNQFLRIRWSSDGITPGSVQVSGVRLEPKPATTTLPQHPTLFLALADGAVQNAHGIEWSLTFATPLAALDIRANGGNSLVPVRVLARNSRDQPWTLLARHVVFSLTQGGSTKHSAPIELSGSRSWRDWRLEADAQTPGFDIPPTLAATFAPLAVVFVTSGNAPFTLAAGRANAAPVALPVTSLIPDYQPAALAALPHATLLTSANSTGSTAAPASPTTTTASSSPALRQWLLWGVLVGGVLVLAALAFALMKKAG